MEKLYCHSVSFYPSLCLSLVYPRAHSLIPFHLNFNDLGELLDIWGLAFIQRERNMEWEHATTHAPSHSCHSPTWELSLHLKLTISFPLLLQHYCSMLKYTCKELPKHREECGCQSSLRCTANLQFTITKKARCHFVNWSLCKLENSSQGSQHINSAQVSMNMDLWSESPKSGVAHRCDVKVKMWVHRWGQCLKPPPLSCQTPVWPHLCVPT